MTDKEKLSMLFAIKNSVSKGSKKYKSADKAVKTIERRRKRK